MRFTKILMVIAQSGHRYNDQFAPSSGLPTMASMIDIDRFGLSARAVWIPIRAYSYPNIRNDKAVLLSDHLEIEHPALLKQQTLFPQVQDCFP